MSFSGLYVTTHRQMTLENQIEGLVRDLANINSPGYRSRSIVESSQKEKTGFGKYLEFSLNAGQIREDRQGQFQRTGNPLNMAILGKGYFSVQTEGGVAYTRDGVFTKDLDGNLITASGHPVLNDGGAPIIIPAGNEGTIQVLGDGTILHGSTPLGRVGVFQFDNENLLEDIGDNLHTTPQEPQAGTKYTIESGGYESSTVDPIVVSSRLLEFYRQYERLDSHNKMIFKHQESATENLITSPLA